MHYKTEISLILPSYLEEENLRLLLPRINAVMKSTHLSYEILIVDTEKPMDQTESACLSNEAQYVNRTGGNSYGDAVRTALRQAKGQFIIFMDSDGSHAPEFIPNLIQFRNENDVVIASRYIEGGYTENSKALIFMSRVLNFSYSIFLNLKCKDVSNSFKLYRASLFRDMPLYCNNFDIIEEILFKMQRGQDNLRIREVPFSFKKRMFGETKRNLFIFILTYVFTIIRLRLSVFLPYRMKQLTTRKEAKLKI